MNRGFTLIEVLVTLFLTSLVALLSHQLLAGVVDGASALRHSSPASTAPTYGREWVLEACRTLEVGTAGTHGFEGTSTSARFDARLVTAAGWVERQAVVIETGAGGVTFRANALAATVIDSAATATLDYLADGAGERGWVTGWSSPVSAPLAIRIRWTRAGATESLLCPIGARG